MQVIDDGQLKECNKGKGKGNPRPAVNPLGVAYLRNDAGSIEKGHQGGHGQEWAKDEHHPRGQVLPDVHPEANPADQDEHGAGNVHQHQVVVELSLEGELSPQATVGA